MHTTLRLVLKTAAVTWLLAAGTSACSHLPVEEIPITANPTEEIDKLAAARDDAVAQQVDVLSPAHFHDANHALHAAQTARAEAKDSKVILASVAEGKASLKKATEVAAISRSTLGTVVQARADAVAANAPGALSQEFAATDKLLTDATEKVEGDDVHAAEQARSSLTKSYADLELRAIKLEKLGAARSTIDKAEKEGAKETAARTFKETKKTLADADAFITANRHDKAGITTHAAAATAGAERLLNIARQVKVAGKTDAESVVLDREAQAGKLTAEVAAGQAAATELATSNAAGATLKAENSKMNSEMAAAKLDDDRLNAAKAQFSPNEADVYRDGNRLVIRMKTIAFPSGKATLPAESFPVLGKVQKVIKDLAAGHVTVEGHTDANGSPKANQKLSDERASAISGYLAANGFEAGNISTVGYGDSKPLTSNKTQEGRAQNRRVDVIIDPSVKL